MEIVEVICKYWKVSIQYSYRQIESSRNGQVLGVMNFVGGVNLRQNLNVHLIGVMQVR